MARRKNVLVKASGDLISNPFIYMWLKNLCRQHYVVILVGGGAQVNDEFGKRGIQIHFGPAGRETANFEERQIARDILEKNQQIVQDMLALYDIHAVAEIPVIYPGGVLCHSNGDIYVMAAYNGFDELYVLTTEERKNEKEQMFAQYPKVQVNAFPVSSLRSGR